MATGNDIRVTPNEKEAARLLDDGFELFSVVPVSQREIGPPQETAGILPYDFVLVKGRRSP
jgi:hypothetical protein